MSFTVPATWRVHATSGDGQSITYTRPGHTVKEPRLAIVSRVVPSYDAKRGLWSVPAYRVRVFDGVLDSDGNPDPTKTLYDLTCRASMNSDGAAAVSSVHDAFLAVVNQAGFAANSVGGQEFPTIATA